MKKRLLSILLAVALGTSLATAASAEEPAVATSAPALWAEELVLIEEPGVEEEPAQTLADAQPDYLGAAEALRRGIAKGEARIYDLGEYHIPAPREEGSPEERAFQRMFHYMRYRYGELFALGYGGSYRANSKGYITSFAPEYTLAAADYKAAQDAYNQELDAIVAQVSAGATDAEKVLFIHDYLAAHYEYDYEHTDENKISDAYTFLKEGKGVCQAYMLTFSALMDKLGIPVSYVESDSLNHAWNVVKLDGKWYHVDVTWDDPAIGSETTPSADVLGAVGHGYFLLSDETNDALRQAWGDAHKKELEKLGVAYEYKKDFIIGEDYIRGEPIVTCTDKTYETGPYADADSPVVYLAGEDSWYYVCTDTVKDGGAGGFYRWTEAEGSVRLGDYSRYIGGVAPLVEYEGSLFFSSPEVICRYEPATGTMTTLHTQPDASAEPLSGIQIENGVLSYKLRVTKEVKEARDVELLPWHDAEGGAFSYYYNFGAVGLKPGDKGRVFIAWYDPASGMMKRLAAADAEGAYGVPVEDKDLVCAVFVLKDDGTLAPVQDKFTVHDVPIAPAQ